MEITYKFYLVLSILILSLATANYVSGSYGSRIVNSLKKYGKRLRVKGRNFKRSVGQTIWGQRYLQSPYEPIGEQTGVGPENVPMTQTEISEKFAKKPEQGWIALIKKALGFDMRTEGEKQLATVLIKGKEAGYQTYDPEHWEFSLTGSYLPVNKTIHRLRLNQEKTVQNQEYTFEWYQTPLTDQDKVDYSVLETGKGAIFAVAVEKSNETGKIINLFCLNIYPNEQNELQALPIASTIDLGIESKHLEYYPNKESEKRLTDYNALLAFVENRLIIDKRILSFTDKKYPFIYKIIPEKSLFYPKEVKEEVEILEREDLETFSLIKTLNENDEFQNSFLKHRPYLKDPISRLRLKTEKNIDINNASYQLQWYQAVRHPEFTSDIVVVVVLKNQAGNIEEFLCLEIKPKNWARIEFKSHEDVTKRALAKYSYEIMEGDYPLTKLEELEALQKFTRENVQELYQLSHLIDWSGSYGTKVID